MHASCANPIGDTPRSWCGRGLEGAKAAPTPYKAIDLADVVSGQFDDEDAAESVAQDLGKRVLAPQTDSPKLHKVLAQAGMGSRLEMEKLITEGRIAVNNEPAHVGQRVQYGDQIKVDGKPIREAFTAAAFVATLP